jgi:threonine dehydratase
MAITLRDIQKAAKAIRGKVIDTPCAYSRTLSHITGAEVILKFENLQYTASFKERGALVKLLSLTPEQRVNGFIAMSAGNHAQAVAYHAQKLGFPAVIVMPHFTPSVKVEHTRAFHAEVILEGEGFDQASAFAQDLSQKRNLHLIHPYDDEKVIAGQGTIALEMLEAHPDLEVLIIPIGGGGLIAGNAIAAKGIKPAIEIVGVQSAQCPSMLRATEGAPLECGTFTIAEGIAVKQPGKLTLPIVQKLVQEIILVEEDIIEEAVLLLLEVEKTVVEGAGAVGLAALMKHPERFSKRKVGLILSGGNIDMPILSSIIQRGLVKSGRMVRLRVDVRDRPGALAEVTKRIGAADINIIQVCHQRAFTNVPLQLAEVEFVLQTRGLSHVRLLMDNLTRAGFKAHLLDRDADAPWC